MGMELGTENGYKKESLGDPDSVQTGSGDVQGSSLKTQQGSDLSVACVGEEQIGELYVNDKNCRLIKRNIIFNGGIIDGINCLLNQTATSSGYINDQSVIDYDILASNGVIHVLQGQLKAPPLPPPTLHPAHKAGMVIGVLVLIILIAAARFVGYNFYTQTTKPFQFHCFKEDEGVEANQSEPSPNISNPVYESTPAPKDQGPT